MIQEHKRMFLIVRLLAALCCCLMAPAIGAQAVPHIAVVGGSAKYHQAVFNALRQTLKGGSEHRLTYETLDELRAHSGAPPLLRVAIGREAARQISRMDDAVPRLYVLISEEDYRALPTSTAAPSSALFLGQPLRRYLALIATALPQRNALGVPLGPISARHVDELQRAAKSLRLSVYAQTIQTSAELPDALQKIPQAISVWLTLPDPVVVNSGTARTLIMSAYQQGKALVGYSQALVKAGALMALHTTPEQFGQEAGEMLLPMLADKAVKALPPARYSHSFSVSVNYQLAQALQLSIPPESELLQRLLQQEASP